MRSFLPFMLVIFLFISCMDKIDLRKFEVNNNSNREIYTIIHKIDIEQDTINNYGFIGDFTDSLDSNIVKEIDRPIDWRTYINKSMGHKFRLYIIEKDSVKKYGWNGIQERNIYNQRYLLDTDDLDSLNWTIEYNGN